MTENNRKTLVIFLATFVVAVGAAIAFIVLSSQQTLGEPGAATSGLYQERLEDGGFILGDPDAPITIVAFEDFLCPHCQRYEPTLKQFIEEYVATGQARFEYRMFTIVNPTFSPLTAQLAECAEELKPGSFWEAHDIMFNITSSSNFAANGARRFAQEIGLSYSELLACTENANQYQVDTQLATQLGATGTPSIFVRYKTEEGLSEPQWIEFGGQVFNRGGVPYDVLSFVIQEANARD